MDSVTLVPPLVATDDTARIITISQIVAGEAKCFCGKYAVLVVDTEPDNEPGPTCYEHAREWIDMASGSVHSLFGPKDERTR